MYANRRMLPPNAQKNANTFPLEISMFGLSKKKKGKNHIITNAGKKKLLIIKKPEIIKSINATIIINTNTILVLIFTSFGYFF